MALQMCLAAMLPWSTIRHLRELRIDSGVWDDFPPSFASLTRLTKLTMAFHNFPPTLLDMKTLRDVSVIRYATHMFGPQDPLQARRLDKYL